MTSIRQIDRFMSEWAPSALSEPWDNDGVMLCEDLDQSVEKVMVCLEINDETLTAAEKNGVSLIITHHPYIFRPLKSICGRDFDIASRLIKNRISVLSYHTRLDAAQNGVNDTLAQRLCLSDVEPFEVLGRVGNLSHPMSADEFFDHIKEKLSCPHIKASDDRGTIKRVAILGGAGKDYVEKAKGVADAYITGDLSHNAFITARECGVLAVDAGHYFTENPVTEKIKQMLEKEFCDLEVSVSDAKCPYFDI